MAQDTDTDAKTSKMMFQSTVSLGQLMVAAPMLGTFVTVLWFVFGLSSSNVTQDKAIDVLLARMDRAFNKLDDTENRLTKIETMLEIWQKQTRNNFNFPSYAPGTPSTVR